MPIQTLNPATGEVVKTFTALTSQDINEKLEAARAAAMSWRLSPIRERASVLRRAADLLEERKTEYGRIMTLEMGKTLKSAIEEAAKCALACRYYADNADRFLADMQVDVSGERSYVAFEPLGVVLAVMPWNFP